MLPPAWGVIRVMSPSRWDTEGSDASSCRVTVVAAPVLAELNTGSDLATTVTSS
jgi:hypothetical protein